MNAERRPRFWRRCPLAESHGCDWTQVTAWFVGGPDVTEEVSDFWLRAEAEQHLIYAHFTPERMIFT